MKKRENALKKQEDWKMKLLILLFSMVALPTTNVRKISSQRHLDEYILTLVKQQTQRPPCPLGPDATQEELKYVVFFFSRYVSLEFTIRIIDRDAGHTLLYERKFYQSQVRISH